ncbi:MAG: MFS transporter [Rhizobiaceae bacterium]
MPDEVNTRRISGPFAPLAYTPFRSLWLAVQGGNFGLLIQAVAAAWMMAVMTNSASMVALVQTATTLPLMLFSLPAGAIADSFQRNRVMVTAHCMLFGFSLLLALFAWLDMLTPWLLLSLTFLVGCGTALNQPSWQASVGDLLPRDQLPAGVTLNAVGFNASRSIAPAIGGIIVGTLGVMAAFVINALLYIPAITILLRWKPERNPNALPPETLGSAISSGLRYFAMSPNLERIGLRGFLFGSSSVCVMALLPFVTREHLKGDATTYGILLGCFGMGAVAAALMSGRLRSMFTPERYIRLMMTLYAAAALVVGASTSLLFTAASLLVCGACWTLCFSRLNVSLQLATSRWVVGRALAIYQTLVFTGATTGSWLWGVFADTQGAGGALAASAVLMLAGAAVGFIYPIPSGMLDFDPLNQFREPKLALDISPRSGPIRIAVEYRIREQDTDTFLEIMEERKRIRRRDGARHWTLARDLEHPDCWIETFHCSTWLDYVRFSHRITKADEDVLKRIRALHSGGDLPTIRRMIERPTVRHDTISPKPPLNMH